MAPLEKTLLGKIFISHSSKDKKFVRRLVAQLERRGFGTWLDERELHAGDHLAERIGEAIATAKVVIVVVSEESLRSGWLRHELNQATELMIKGKCRLIPALIGSVEPPAEIHGILYTDFRHSFKRGLDKVLDTLQHECERYASQEGFWATTERLLAEEFDGQGCGSIFREYRDLDYDFVVVKAGESDALNDKHVVYEIVPDYLQSGEPLSAQWWQEYGVALGDFGERFALVLSERPIGFPVDRHDEGTGSRLARTTSYSANVDEVLVIVIDMSGEPGENEKRQLLRRAKQIIQTTE